MTLRARPEDYFTEPQPVVMYYRKSAVEDPESQPEASQPRENNNGLIILGIVAIVACFLGVVLLLAVRRK